MKEVAHYEDQISQGSKSLSINPFKTQTQSGVYQLQNKSDTIKTQQTKPLGAILIIIFGYLSSKMRLIYGRRRLFTGISGL